MDIKIMLDEFVKDIKEQTRYETAKEIIEWIFSYIGSQQQFCIVDDGHKMLIDCDKLFDFLSHFANQFDIEIK